MTPTPFQTRSLIALLGACLLVACGKTDPATPGAPGKGAPGGGAITVVTTPAQKRDLEINLQAIGTVTPIASVDIKAQTTSIVTGVHVREGQSVKKGTLLFTLDGRPDEANVAKIKAQVVKDEAALADAQRQLARAKDLVSKGFVSQGATDTNQAQVDGLMATVAADRAALDAAKLALSYSRVVAPASGRLGAVTLSLGTAVQANVTTLVTLTQMDPINVSFNLPQRNLSGLLAGLQGGGAMVSAKLPEDKAVVQGRLVFVDNAVDASTGTVKVKAKFDNKGEKLWPGAFVNVSLRADTLKDVTVIPTATIIQTARGPMVYTTANGKAVSRPLTVITLQGEDAVVTGIEPGERVVLEGRQNLRPDMAVTEREAPAKVTP